MPPQGITVLVSTHYMDEAERCHEIAYIAYGELMARGTAEDIITAVRPHRLRGDRPGRRPACPEVARRAGRERRGRLRHDPPCLRPRPRAEARTRHRALSAPIPAIEWEEAEPTLGRHLHPSHGKGARQCPRATLAARPPGRAQANLRAHWSGALLAMRTGFGAGLGAIITKEVRQLRRDRLTFAMMFGMPIMQLLLFGYAIDTDPHRLPTAVVAADQSQITRTILSALANTGYMRFTHQPKSEAEANELLQSGEVQFVVTIPSDFTRRLVRGERAQILIDADATDPMAAANPLAAAKPAIDQALAARPRRPAQSRCAMPPIPSMWCCSAATTPRASRT